jgi:hypothetical protein
MNHKETDQSRWSRRTSLWPFKKDWRAAASRRSRKQLYRRKPDRSSLSEVDCTTGQWFADTTRTLNKSIEHRLQDRLLVCSHNNDPLNECIEPGSFHTGSEARRWRTNQNESSWELTSPNRYHDPERTGGFEQTFQRENDFSTKSTWAVQRLWSKSAKQLREHQNELMRRDCNEAATGGTKPFLPTKSRAHEAWVTRDELLVEQEQRTSGRENSTVSVWLDREGAWRNDDQAALAGGFIWRQKYWWRDDEHGAMQTCEEIDTIFMDNRKQRAELRGREERFFSVHFSEECRVGKGRILSSNCILWHCSGETMCGNAEVSNMIGGKKITGKTANHRTRICSKSTLVGEKRADGEGSLRRKRGWICCYCSVLWSILGWFSDKCGFVFSISELSHICVKASKRTASYLSLRKLRSLKNSKWW